MEESSPFGLEENNGTNVSIPDGEASSDEKLVLAVAAVEGGRVDENGDDETQEKSSDDGGEGKSHAIQGTTPTSNGSLEAPLSEITAKHADRKRNSLITIGEHTPVESAATSSWQRKSSLEMRKMPVNVLLHPTHRSDAASVLSDGLDEDESIMKMKDMGATRDLLRFLCLRPNYTLRKQMMLSFGSINLITIFLVVLVCVILSLSAGKNVKDTSSESIEKMVKGSLAYKSRYLAESLTESIILFDVVDFLLEATQDRFQGHPTAGDDHVPFFDLVSQSNRYPVRGPDMPLEWDVSPNVNESNYGEHLQSRWEVYKDTPIDTRHAGFIMQGACDPLELDPLADTYWPNCTDENNNVLTGGVISPSNQTGLYYRKGGDMVPTLRGLFEQWEVIRDLGLYFLNEGAGASVNYPHYRASTQSTYTSIGCDWLLSDNPYDPQRTIGTQDMLRNCRPEGETVSSRLYNPMEREFCREQALNPDKLFADTYENAWNPGEWLLVLGKGIYDRMTKEFVACMYVGINLEKINKLLETSKTSRKAEATVIEYSEGGFVVASSKNLTYEGRLPIFEANLGFENDTYAELYHLIDFDSEWDAEEVLDAYKAFSTREDDFYVAVHPMPPVPDEYDPDYQPLFFVVTSFHRDDMYASFALLDDSIDDRVANIISFASICGAVGLLVSAVIIFAMARMLTAPLTNMNKVANEIVGSFGDSKKEDEIRQSGDVSHKTKCSPRTELSDVVVEFNKMVANFSGASEARSEKFKDDDLENTFPARSEVFPLYKSRADGIFKYNPTNEYLDYAPAEKGDASSFGGCSVEYLHFGPNYISAMTPLTNGINGHISVTSGSSLKKCSGLFLWTVLLIATPLLFITILVSVGVITSINVEFSRSTLDIQEEYLELQQVALLSFARLRSGFVSSFSEKSTKDLALYTRYSSWLLFGGLNRSGTFTDLTTGIEDCKNYSDDFSQCPYVVENFVCDCAWGEKDFEESCDVFADPSMSRSLQKPFFISEVSNSPNGDRLTTTFPDYYDAPETGFWWDDVNILPGANVSGYDSTYNRVQVISSVPMMMPLYNHGRGGGEGIMAALGIGFEADGTFVLYEGCRSANHAALSSWSSNSENRASEFRPELCPLGKFGYDPRCRGWYNTGRERWLTNGSLLHITAPYLFAQGTGYGQTATIAVVDPITSEHVGQTILDFVAQPIYRSLLNHTYVGLEGFPILIAVHDGSSPETIIGPNASVDEVPLYISEGVLPCDHMSRNNDDSQERIRQFELIIESMKNGESTVTTFARKKRDGTTEMMHIAYSPVYVSSIEPADNSDYARGVKEVKQLVYSLALVETEDEMLLPFREIEDTTKQQTIVAICILTVVILLATLSIVYISRRLASSFSEPMIYLLRLLKTINECGSGQDPTLVKEINASQEIVAFSKTLEALFRIVRSANIAFFNGELDFAYRVLNDALRLFRRLDNKKAIGIASNNLGNILLAMYREMTAAELDKLCGLTREDIISQGILHFHNAIQLGEKAYDEFYEMQGWSPSCLNFMQHLANRYFNRGLFLLHIKGDHKSPKEIEGLGMRDIQIARDMDREVVEYGEEIGWGSTDRAEKRFNVNVGRIRSFNILYALGYRHNWGVEDLINETVDIVRTEYTSTNSDFFSCMSLGGRLQDLEIQLMRYHSYHEDLETAAKIAVRMIIEDERVFTEAMRQALDVLIEYYSESKQVDAEVRSKTVPALRAYRKEVAETISEKRRAAKEDVGSASVSLTKSLASSVLQQVECPQRSELLNPTGEESSRFVVMEDF